MSRQRQITGSTTQVTCAPSRPVPVSLPPVAEETLCTDREWQSTPSYTIGGGSSCSTARSVRTGGGSKVIADRNVFKTKPWAAPSVQELSGQMGRVREADPLVVEGPAGDILTAVGSRTDHRIAGDVLSRVQHSRIQRGEAMPRGPPVPLTTSSKSNPAGPPPTSSNRGSRAGVRSFGAVYEHRDCFGVPKYVGHTDDPPEQKFAQDASQHQAVRNMLTYESGRSNVVWAGTGSYPLGPQEMQSITSSIVERRAKELHMQKLSGPKPYSRHGY